MPSFKAMVDEDILNVFIDVDYFGEVHVVEGKEIPIVIDTDELKDVRDNYATAESGTVIFAKVADLPVREAGESINIDNREYLIDQWDVDMGVARIVLRENLVK